MLQNYWASAIKDLLTLLSLDTPNYSHNALRSIVAHEQSSQLSSPKVLVPGACKVRPMDNLENRISTLIELPRWRFPAGARRGLKESFTMYPRCTTGAGPPSPPMGTIPLSNVA